MDLLSIIEKMDALKEELDNLRPLRDDYLNRLNQKIKLDWNYHSNSIEGNTLSRSETKSFLLWGVTAKGKPFRDYLEMKGHNEALKKLYEVVHKDINITERLIKDFHKIVLVEPYADELAEVNPGEWKILPNYLHSPTGERIDFSPPEDIPRLMNELVNWLNNHISPPKRKKKKYDLHPLLIATGFHLRFIRIHPFGDGNGRMARIMSNLIFMLCGYVPAIVKQERRQEYYTALNTSEINNIENLAIFLGECIIETLEISIKAAKGQSIEEDDDIDKELRLLEQRLKAKKVDVPLKSQDSIDKILHNTVLPFFENIMRNLSRFDHLFNDRQITVNDSPNSLKVYQSDKSNVDYIINDIKNTTKRYQNYISFNYHLIQLTNIVEEFSIYFRLILNFNRGHYTISDSLKIQAHTLNYNEQLSEQQQQEWIKKIQKHLLAQIQEVVNK